MDTWADCENCVNFKIEFGVQICEKFQLTGLPILFIEKTNRKCCSSFEAKINEIKVPNFKQMDYGTLYFYNFESPKILIEDVDL